MEYQIILSGSGGQGIIMAGVLLGEAAGIFDGKNAAQTSYYGIEARGGISTSGVIISDHEISCPEVYDPNLIITLTRQAYEKYRYGLLPKTVLVYDCNAINGDSLKNVRGFPLTETAKRVAKEIGINIMVNILSIGLVVSISKAVPLEAIRKALEHKFGKTIAYKNMLLVKEGLLLADKA